jgi:hypothetical protein
MAKKFSAARRAAFLRALSETGNQTIAAERAKVSRSWVTLHRASDPEFRGRMEAAVAEAKRRLRGASAVAPGASWGSLDGEELVVRGGNGRRVQIARARMKQWTPRLEARFLETLAATCNVKAACAAVGLSVASAYQHADRWAAFANRWQAAVEEGYFRIELQLMERSSRSLSLSPAQADAGAATDEALFHQLYMHQHGLRGIGKAPGRPLKLRLEARDEAVAVLLKGIERVEARKKRGLVVSEAVRAADRREWDRRGAS